MLTTLFQVAGELTPEQLQALQKIGADSGPAAAGGMFGALAGFMLIGFAIAIIVGIIIAVLMLINLYHWGMTDKAAFEKAGEDKKKWYYNLILIPFLSGVIIAIPFIGWVIGSIGYIYSFVMLLIYFFSVRKKAV